MAIHYANISPQDLANKQTLIVIGLGYMCNDLF